MLLPGATGQVALEVAERLRRATSEGKLVWAGAELKLTCSVGIASYPDPIKEVANLVDAADAALYRAKQAGRDRIERATAAAS